METNTDVRWLISIISFVGLYSSFMPKTDRLSSIGLFQVLFNICLNLATRSLPGTFARLGAYFLNWNCVEALYDVLRFYWLKTPLEARTFISTVTGPLSRR